MAETIRPAHAHLDASGASTDAGGPGAGETHQSGGNPGQRTANARGKSRRHAAGNRGHGLYAALDLGTNNCRLLIVRANDHGFRVIDGFTRIVRLGEGVSLSGKLSEGAIARTLDALRQCRKKLAQYDLQRTRLIATEACRAASNAPEFLKQVSDVLGMELEIIDRRTEAELAVIGCADLIAADAQGALLFDIGGGSSELAWLDFRGGRPKSQGKMAAAIRSWQSLPVGVVSIAERFGGNVVTSELFEDMILFVGEQLRQFRGREKLRAMLDTHPMHLIGTSGTVTTLAGLHLGLTRYDRSKVDGLWLDEEDALATMRVLLGMDYEKRCGHPCIGRDRADLVIPGCAIFEAIRREWPAKRIRVADRGLREGMLMSLIAEDRAGGRQKAALSDG